MSDRVNDRFEEFRRRFLADGTADPREFLHDLEGNDRTELGLLIEHFLIELPPRPWDEEEFRRTGAATLAERVTADLVADDPSPRERLADLRMAAQITRESLVARLSEDLGLPGETERVGFYYHHMERGSLPVEGVSEPVFTTLARILRVGVDRLRRAAFASREELGQTEVIFARAVTGTSPELEIADADTLKLAVPDGSKEVDRLFTGG